MTRSALAVVGSVALLTLMAGCTPVQSGPLSVSPERYPAAFQAARDVLRDADFVLERTDVRAGVLTTAVKTTVGAASPWDEEQSTAGQEMEDLFNRQARTVRVVFSPRGSVSDPAGLADVRAASVPIDVEVVATLYRRQRPGWRPDSTGVSLHRHWADSATPVRGEQVVAIDEDRDLAAKLKEQIRRRLAAEAAAPVAPAASDTADVSSGAPASP